MAKTKKTRKAKTTKRAASKRAATARGKNKPTTREQMSASIKSQTAAIKMLKSAGREAPSTKRPPKNPDMPQDVIEMLNADFNSILELLEAFSQHLRALDRMRLNGVGIKKLGFINRAYELALENGEFLPHYLTIERFGTDIQYFLDFRTLVDLVAQIREKLWNITIQSADIAYTDALEFYAPVREGAKRRVDAAETLYNALAPFFKHHRGETEDSEAQPTKKQALRDFKALESNKHDGKLIIENIKPKLTGGKRQIIDETFKDTAKFKGTVDGEIEE